MAQEKDGQDDSPRIMPISVIQSQKEITVPPDLVFETEAVWAPSAIFWNSLREKAIPAEIIKGWLFDNEYSSLTDALAASEMLHLPDEKIFAVVENLSREKKNALAEFYMSQMDEDTLYREWQMKCSVVGFALYSKLGLVRLGVNARKDLPRLWIGRSPEANSKILKYRGVKDADYWVMGERFISAFLGYAAIHTFWSLQYRGGLWRFVIGLKGKRSYVYIEEFDSATYPE